MRPAAIEQLQTLGESIDVEVFTLGVEAKALETARQAMRYAQENGYIPCCSIRPDDCISMKN
ncbi:MAG: hypothetical protein ACLVJ6_14310 [Merdibacter sp.]